MSVSLIFLVCFIVASQSKILGSRSASNFPTDWEIVGQPCPYGSKVNFIVALKQQNLDVLEETFYAVSDPDHEQYRNFLSIEEITKIVAPPEHDRKVVLKWLKANGVTEKIVDNGDSLEVTCTVEVAERLFYTEFRTFRHKVHGKTLIRQFGDFSIPSHMEKYVDMVLGLSEFPVGGYTLKKSPKTVQKANSSSPDILVSIVPQTVQVIYGTGSAKVGSSGASVGVIEFEQQYFAPSDLQAFAQSFALNIAPVSASRTVGFNDPTNPQLEATLDIQYVLGVALGATGWFWIEADPVWLYGFATHFFTTTNIPQVVSISYGWNEEDQCENGIGSSECEQLGVNSQQYVQRVNVEFQKIGLRGTSLISASGDSGANGRTDPDCSENHLNPPYPAASPYITAVGATQIDTGSGVANLPNPPPGCAGQSCASGGYEEAVSYSQARFASGGGFSFVASTPAYQKSAVQSYLSSGVTLPPSGYYNANGRGFPDVAAFGSNVLISSGGQLEGVGGTSCSSPIIAGVVTLLNDYVITKTGKPLGFLNPLLYKMATACPNCFNDITTGDNICTEDGCSSSCYGFTCTKGWDPVSGLGSPHYANMLNYIKTNVLKEKH
jgi:tripeptidyl-peptidase-1